MSDAVHIQKLNTLGQPECFWSLTLPV